MRSTVSSVWYHICDKLKKGRIERIKADPNEKHKIELNCYNGSQLSINWLYVDELTTSYFLGGKTSNHLNFMDVRINFLKAKQN